MKKIVLVFIIVASASLVGCCGGGCGGGCGGDMCGAVNSGCGCSSCWY